MNYPSSAKKVGLGICALFLAEATRLWAGEATREDNSNIFVWIFLAFCALIIVAQLIPAVMMLLGFAKGVKKAPEQPTSKAAEDPTPPKA